MDDKDLIKKMKRNLRKGRENEKKADLFRVTLHTGGLAVAPCGRKRYYTRTIANLWLATRGRTPRCTCGGKLQKRSAVFCSCFFPVSSISLGRSIGLIGNVLVGHPTFPQLFLHTRLMETERCFFIDGDGRWRERIELPSFISKEPSTLLIFVFFSCPQSWTVKP